MLVLSVADALNLPLLQHQSDMARLLQARGSRGSSKIPQPHDSRPWRQTPPRSWEPSLSPVSREIQRNEIARAQLLSGGSSPESKQTAQQIGPATAGNNGPGRGTSFTETLQGKATAQQDALLRASPSLETPDGKKTGQRTDEDRLADEEKLVDIPSSVKNPLFDASTSASIGSSNTTDISSGQHGNVKPDEAYAWKQEAKSSASFRSAIRRAADRSRQEKKMGNPLFVNDEAQTLEATQQVGKPAPEGSSLPRALEILPSPQPTAAEAHGLKAQVHEKASGVGKQGGLGNVIRGLDESATPETVTSSVNPVAKLWNSGRQATESLQRERSQASNISRGSVRCSLLSSMNSVSNGNRYILHVLSDSYFCIYIQSMEMHRTSCSVCSRKGCSCTMHCSFG